MREEGQKRLTLKQRLFIREYLKDFKAKDAAIRAGYAEKSAAVAANNNLKNPLIQPHLDKIIEEMEYRVELEVEDIIQEAANIVTNSNICDMVDITNGRAITLKSLDDLNPEQQRTIHTLKETPNGVEIKLYDKLKALQLLGKWKGLESLKLETGKEFKIKIDVQDEGL